MLESAWRLGSVSGSVYRFGLASLLGVGVGLFLGTALVRLGVIISHCKVEATRCYYSSNNMVTNNYG